jgi:hypothetical protein
MPLPTDTDYRMRDIELLAQNAVQSLWTIYFQSKTEGQPERKRKQATAAIVYMRGELKLKLTELCKLMMEQAARCQAMTEVEPAAPAPHKPRRRQIERIPKRRRK